MSISKNMNNNKFGILLDLALKLHGLATFLGKLIIIPQGSFPLFNEELKKVGYAMIYGMLTFQEDFNMED